MKNEFYIIWLYEIGIEGIGVMRATYDLLRKDPDRFWTVLADKMMSCSTASDKAFLRHLLAQPIEWLQEYGDLVNVVTATGSPTSTFRYESFRNWVLKLISVVTACLMVL